MSICKRNNEGRCGDFLLTRQNFIVMVNRLVTAFPGTSPCVGEGRAGVVHGGEGECESDRGCHI